MAPHPCEIFVRVFDVRFMFICLTWLGASMTIACGGRDFAELMFSSSPWALIFWGLYVTLILAADRGARLLNRMFKKSPKLVAAQQ